MARIFFLFALIYLVNHSVTSDVGCRTKCHYTKYVVPKVLRLPYKKTCILQASQNPYAANSHGIICKSFVSLSPIGKLELLNKKSLRYIFFLINLNFLLAIWYFFVGNTSWHQTRELITWFDGKLKNSWLRMVCPCSIIKKSNDVRNFGLSSTWNGRR